MILLKHETDVSLVQFDSILRSQLVYGLAEEVVLAKPVAVEHSQDRQQRGFPCARRAHDGEKVALLDVQADAAQDEGLAHTSLVEFFEVS